MIKGSAAANSLIHAADPLINTKGHTGADFSALLTNPTLGMASGHVVSASILTGGMLMAVISAWHLSRRTPDYALFRTSLRIGLVSAMTRSCS